MSPLGHCRGTKPCSQVRFTVLIESSAGSEKTWEVALWHSFEGANNWTSLQLNSIAEPSVVGIIKHQYTI